MGLLPSCHIVEFIFNLYNGETSQVWPGVTSTSTVSPIVMVVSWSGWDGLLLPITSIRNFQTTGTERQTEGVSGPGEEIERRVELWGDLNFDNSFQFVTKLRCDLVTVLVQNPPFLTIKRRWNSVDMFDLREHCDVTFSSLGPIESRV